MARIAEWILDLKDFGPQRNVITMKSILSLGQCAFDHDQLTRAFGQSAQVLAVGNEIEAIALVDSSSFDLLLVNREFDEDGASGIAFIQNHCPMLKAKGIPVMLISNYQEAQAKAVAIGALEGFGKANLSQAKMAQILKQL